MIYIRHTFVFSEILWITVMTNRLVEVGPFFYGSSLCVRGFHQVFCAHNIITQHKKRMWLHIPYSSPIVIKKEEEEEKKFGVKRNLCEKKVDDNNEPKPKIIFKFHKFNWIHQMHEWRSTNIRLKQENILKYSRLSEIKLVIYGKCKHSKNLIHFLLFLCGYAGKMNEWHTFQPIYVISEIRILLLWNNMYVNKEEPIHIKADHWPQHCMNLRLRILCSRTLRKTNFIVSDSHNYIIKSKRDLCATESKCIQIRWFDSVMLDAVAVQLALHAICIVCSANMEFWWLAAVILSLQVVVIFNVFTSTIYLLINCLKRLITVHSGI